MWNDLELFIHKLKSNSNNNSLLRRLSNFNWFDQLAPHVWTMGCWSPSMLMYSCWISRNILGNTFRFVERNGRNKSFKTRKRNSIMCWKKSELSGNDIAIIHYPIQFSSRLSFIRVNEEMLVLFEAVETALKDKINTRRIVQPAIKFFVILFIADQKNMFTNSQWVFKIFS